jgi:SapC
MANIVPISQNRHGGKRWRATGGYAFAATQALLPLVGLEFANAAISMPIAFAEQSGRYLAVAVMSPIQGRNLFIGPSGQWLGHYVPAVLRSYPFHLRRIDGSDQVTLCIDEDSGWLVEGADPAAAPFFEEDGTPAAGVKAVADFLQQVEHSRMLTDKAVAAIAEARLLHPWSLTTTIGNQQVTATGLYRIDEAALNAVSEETFLKLRSTFALIYAQLISMHTAAAFKQLAMMQQHLVQQAKPLPSASSLFPTDDGGTIRFN